MLVGVWKKEMEPIEGGAACALHWVGGLLQMRWWKRCLGPEARQAVRQSGPALVLLWEMMCLFALPYSHDSVLTPEPLGLVTWDETKANVFCPRLPQRLSGGRPVLLAQGSQSHCRGYHQAISSSSFAGCRLRVLHPYWAVNLKQTVGTTCFFNPLCFKFRIKCPSCKIHLRWLVKCSVAMRFSANL